MTSLFPSVIEAFPKVTRTLEGCVLWPYLDVFGLATVGYGCLIDSVPEFRKPSWVGVLRTDKYIAVVDQSRAVLKSRPKALHFKQYENDTPLRLVQESADELLIARADEFAEYMASHYFGDWNTWPADAQLAWMLIAWACGPGAPGIFKTAAHLAQTRQWDAMRKWAKIKVGTKGQADYNPGIVPRNAQIDLCLANAAAIDSPDGYATPALYWPGHVTDSPKTVAATLPVAAVAAAQLASYDVEACGLTGSCHLPEVA